MRAWSVGVEVENRARDVAVEDRRQRLGGVDRFELETGDPRRRVPVAAAPSGVEAPYVSPIHVEVAVRSSGLITTSPMSAPRDRISSAVLVASRLVVTASSLNESLTTTPNTRVDSPARRRPSARPATVPPEPTAETIVAGSGSSPAATWSAISRATSTYPRLPTGDEPPAGR